MSNISYKKWLKLQKPPVILAIFQVKFDQKDPDISVFLDYDTQIRHVFPKRKDNMLTNLEVPGTIALGVSKITSTTNTKITGYVYSTEDHKKNLQIEQGSLVYADECKYEGWNNFKEFILSFLNIYRPQLDKFTILRISIRFINKISFDESEDPTAYFNTLVSTSSDKDFAYPLTKYSFKMFFNIPDTNRNAIVNQDLEINTQNKYDYIFDIDVLDNKNHNFDISFIEETIEELRIIKNNIFFDNITPRTIELCN